MTIANEGENLFVRSKDRESISLGRIFFDKAGLACFIPTHGMSFTHQMLFELSEYVKNTGEAYAQHRTS
jgi:hypothetical protein